MEYDEKEFYQWVDMGNNKKAMFQNTAFTKANHITYYKSLSIYCSNEDLS